MKSLPAQRMSVSLLGRFEVQVDGRTVIDRTWPRRKAQALLKVLSLQEHHTLHREQVMEHLWPDMTPQSAGNNLRQALHYLRSRQAEYGVTAEFVSLAGGVLSLHSDVQVDVDRFNRLALQSLEGGDPQVAEEALSTYAGDLLPDDLYEEWTGPRREELRELRNQLLLRLGDIHEEAGNTQAAIARLRELLRIDPACEQAHMGVMRIYARSARREQALRQYTRLRESLQKELGVEPSAEAEDLHRSILEGGLAPLEGPAVSSPEPPAPPFPAALRLRDISRFVGRERELAQLQEEWDRARSGECRLVFIAGQAGIGKTRLAAEFASALYAEGATVLFGRCDEEPLDPYQPITPALRTYLGAPRVQGPALALLRARPALARLVPGAVTDAAFAATRSTPPAGVIDDGSNERLRFFDDVASLLQEIAARPTLLILDDLHWAEKPALLLLKHIVQSHGEASPFIIGSYRDDEVTRAHPLSNMLADLRRDRAITALELKGLDEASIAALMSARGVGDAPPALVEAISQHTDGNPFFIEETIRHLTESGALGSADGWSSRGWTIPQGVKDVVGRRIMRLSPDCNRLLQIASAVGSEVTSGLLQSISGMEHEQLLDELDEAMQARVIAEVPEARDRYRFAHDLIRSVLYEELSSGRRARLHQLIGEALEAQPAAKQEESYAELAYHFFEANSDPERAIRYSRLAGDQALTLLAYEEAALHYQRALRVIEQRGDADADLKCEVLLSLGDAQARAGEKAMGHAAFEQAAAIARALGRGTLLARAALGRAGTWVGAGFGDPAVISLLEEVSDRVAPADAALRVRVLSRLAVELYYGDSRERRLDLSKRAVEEARTLREPRELAYALNARYYAVWGPGSVEERLDIASEMLALAETAGDQELVLQGHHFRAFGLLELGDIQAVQTEVQAYQHLAEALRQPIYLYRSAARRGMLALLEGRFADVEKSVAEAYEISRTLGDPNARVEIGVQTLVLRREEGRLPEVMPVIETFVANYPALPGWGAALAFASVEQGNLDEARERFALLTGAAMPEDATWLASQCLLSEVCTALGDSENACRLYEAILPHEAHNAVIGAGSAFSGSVAYYLGILAALLSRGDDAAQHFESALAMHAKMEARPWLARTQYAYGRMLKDRGREQDARRAEELLNEATATAKSLGMKSFGKVPSSQRAP